MQLKKITPPEINETMIEEIVTKIVNNFNPEKVIIFGSQVWGKPGVWSDIDILIIMNYNGISSKVAAKVSKIARPKYVPMDIIIRTPEEIDQRIKLNDHFIKRIMSGGKVLYDRAVS